MCKTDVLLTQIYFFATTAWCRVYSMCFPIGRNAILVFRKNMSQRPKAFQGEFYRKPTHTDKCLSFNSHHPGSHKKSVVTTLFQRAENLTSNNDARENERQYVTNVLKENNNPKSFLHDCLRRLTLTDCNSPEGDSAVKSFAIIPYIQGIAKSIRRVLNNCGIKVPSVVL